MKEGNILINNPKRDDARPDIFKTKCIYEVNKVVVSRVADDYKHEVEAMTESYVPKKERDVNVKMTIVLKNHESVYQRAERLALSGREKVNTQIGETV